ncbi:MAG: protein kinase [Propionibacteriales bacterium]|nr:protein kinase [Propionibacteriales bacterium]
MTTTPAQSADAPRIGRYQLLAKIGEGGMGVVHLARGPQGERVALKVLRDHVVGDDEGRSRLAREVTTLRRVRSPRVAEVYDADPWGERPFVVTRYVPGRSLHTQVREEGPLSEPDLRFLALGLSEALVAVHRAGVLHRDIKPSNVLLEGRAPVLIDFGLAKLSDDARLTLTGWLMGTPGYLAPEVLYGEEPTPAADVHAWAATVVFAASGVSPYGSGPAMAVMDRARRGEYNVSALPTDLRPLVQHSLSPDPAGRPSAPELAARLARLQTAPRGVAPPQVMTAPVQSPAPVSAVPAPPGQPVLAPPLVQPPSPTRPYTVPVRPDEPAVERAPVQRAPAQAPSVARPSTYAPLLRLATSFGAGAVVTAAFALAPYLMLFTTLLLLWLLRTASISGDAHSERQALRGARRGDGFVRAMALPWHLFVASWGTVALVVCAGLAALAVFGFTELAGVSDLRGLLAAGAVFTAGLWWGPGGRRVRNRMRRRLWQVARPDQAGVAWMLGLWLLAVVVVIVSTQIGVVWAPAQDSPYDLDVLGL